jgi:hypothetical protein
MGTCTCQILLGSNHPYHGGILPGYQLFLRENDRAAWILRKIPPVEENDDEEAICWIPVRPETIMRDAMMMLAYHLLKESKFVRETEAVMGGPVGKGADLNNLGWDSAKKEWNNSWYDKVDELYESCKKIKNWPSMVITILSGSSLENSKLDNGKWAGGLKVLNDYDIEAEVCLSQRISEFRNAIDQTRGGKNG